MLQYFSSSMEETIQNNENNVQEENSTDLVTEDKPLDKKALKREKRYNKIRNRLFKENDIKYEGPLSYRYLRIFAWIFLAFGQIVLLNSLSESLLNQNALGPFGASALSLLSSLSTPLFIIASFGMVLNKRRKAFDYILLYGLAYLGVGLGFIFFYLRYVNGLFVNLGVDKLPFITLFEGFLSDKVQVNVFADLFAFVLFHFFLNYKPKKFFKGKLLIVFRLFTFLPILFILTSYVLKILAATNQISMPFYIFPFLTTKSPIVFLVFVLAALWIKNREKWYLRLGASKEQYNEYLKTKRNSLHVSISLTIIILISILFDVLLLIIAVIYFTATNLPVEKFSDIAIDTFGVGQASSMLLAVPFIFLYSYKRQHKDTRIDLLIPIVGIALIALVYVEGIYQFILEFLK